MPPSFLGNPVFGSCIRSSPTAGTLLEYNPFFERFNNHNHDAKPKDICCKSGHCDWFYEVRPITRCYRRSPFSAGGCFNIICKTIKIIKQKNLTNTKEETFLLVSSLLSIDMHRYACTKSE